MSTGDGASEPHARPFPRNVAHHLWLVLWPLPTHEGSLEPTQRVLPWVGLVLVSSGLLTMLTVGGWPWRVWPLLQKRGSSGGHSLLEASSSMASFFSEKDDNTPPGLLSLWCNCRCFHNCLYTVYGFLMFLKICLTLIFTKKDCKCIFKNRLIGLALLPSYLAVTGALGKGRVAVTEGRLKEVRR